jgi:hypothetical protein
VHTLSSFELQPKGDQDDNEETAAAPAAEHAPDTPKPWYQQNKNRTKCFQITLIAG